MTVFAQYMGQHCNKKGEQKANLTFSQRKGLVKLRRRIKEKEIFVILTDKTGKLAVVTREIYEEMGSVHTDKDREIQCEEIRDTQRRLNGHTSSWIKISGMGENWNHTERIRETCINWSYCVAPMHLLYKDHKERREGEVLKSRPVVSSCSGMGIHLNNILSEFVEPIADNVEGKIEVISAEDMLNKIDRLNKLIEVQEKEKQEGIEVKEMIDLGEAILTGADAVSLYPSLLKYATAATVGEEAVKTKVKWSNINYKEGARYLAINCEPWEIKKMGLTRIVPRRRF